VGCKENYFMRWLESVVRMTEMRNIYAVLVRKLEGDNHLGDLGIDVLKKILNSV
jgi:hypothetical protein